MKPFCASPFSQLHLGLNGEVTPCCWGRDIIVGNAKTTPIMEIWNSEAMQSLRAEFLSGKIKRCRHHMEERSCHRYQQGLYEHVERSAVQKRPPRMLQVRLSGQCNLKCEMCEIWKQRGRPYEESDLWTEGPREIFPFLDRMTVVGGEPFIQSDTFKLIDLVTKVNPHCKWQIVTNGQWGWTSAIETSLDRIRDGNVTVSLDSISPKMYTQIRTGGTLAKALQTLENLISYRERRKCGGANWGISASMTVQKANWQEAQSFFEFCKDKSVRPYFGPLFNPREKSLTTLSRHENQRARELFNELLFSTKEESIFSILRLLRVSNVGPEWEAFESGVQQG